MLGLCLDPQEGLRVLGLSAESLGPGLGLQAGFGVLDPDAESTGRIRGGGRTCYMHKQGLTYWG